MIKKNASKDSNIENYFHAYCSLHPSKTYTKNVSRIRV